MHKSNEQAENEYRLDASLKYLSITTYTVLFCSLEHGISFPVVTIILYFWSSITDFVT